VSAVIFLNLLHQLFFYQSCWNSKFLSNGCLLIYPYIYLASFGFRPRVLATLSLTRTFLLDEINVKSTS